jgi:hypothetical protein
MQVQDHREALCHGAGQAGGSQIHSGRVQDVPAWTLQAPASRTIHRDQGVRSRLLLLAIQFGFNNLNVHRQRPCDPMMSRSINQ